MFADEVELIIQHHPRALKQTSSTSICFRRRSLRICTPCPLSAPHSLAANCPISALSDRPPMQRDTCRGTQNGERRSESHESPPKRLLEMSHLITAQISIDYRIPIRDMGFAYKLHIRHAQPWSHSLCIHTLGMERNTDIGIQISTLRAEIRKTDIIN